MKFWKKNDGLTLIELMISIAIGTMIFAAATTVLLLGIRINHHTTDSIMQQYTARTVISMMEQMAEEGSVNKTYRAPDGSWKLGTKPSDKADADQEPGEFANVVLSYSSIDQTIFTGNYDTDNKTPILENVIATGSSLDLRAKSKYIGSYVRFQIKNEGGILLSQPFVCDDGNMEAKLIDYPEQEPLTFFDEIVVRIRKTLLGELVYRAFCL